MKTYREIASKYAMATKNHDYESPVKVAVDVWRYTNSSKTGRGESRLIDIAIDKFEEYFDSYRTWDTKVGYMHDTHKALAMLNIRVYWIAYVVVNMATVEVGRGVVRF